MQLVAGTALIQVNNVIKMQSTLFFALFYPLIGRLQHSLTI